MILAILPFTNFLWHPNSDGLCTRKSGFRVSKINPGNGLNANRKRVFSHFPLNFFHIWWLFNFLQRLRRKTLKPNQIVDKNLGENDEKPCSTCVQRIFQNPKYCISFTRPTHHYRHPFVPLHLLCKLGCSHRYHAVLKLNSRNSGDVSLLFSWCNLI